MIFAGATRADVLTGTYNIDTIYGSQTIGTGSGPFDMTSTDSTYSLLTLTLGTPVLFSNLTALSVSYDALLGGIGGGTPRLEVDFADNSWLEINFGPPGSFADSTLGPGNSGNLIAMTDTGRFDNTGVGGGFYSNLASAETLAGNKSVVDFTLIIDSFGGNDRHFTIDSIDGSFTSTAVPEGSIPTFLAFNFLALSCVILLGRRVVRPFGLGK